MNENKAIPGWVTADFLTEARRLQGSSREEPRPKSSVSEQLYHADPNDIEDLWTDMFGEKHTAHPDTCWLTPAGHTALAAIEAEESAPRAHGNCLDGECERCNAVDEWTPRRGDRVRVNTGDYKGRRGVFQRVCSVPTFGVVREGSGADTYFEMANLEPEEVIEYEQKQKPMRTGHCSMDSTGKVTASLPGVPVTQESVAEQIRKAVMSAVLSNPGQVPDEVNIKVTLPGSIRNVVVGDMGNGRADGHDTGPILTGNARESYLAIHSGAEDPHAKPEPPTEPACDYCKDTGVGELGMDCPVRTCEAVAS